MSGSLLEVRKKIAGVQNTSKITKAMQLVAASKMRQFQKRAINTRRYSWDLLEILEKTLKLEDSKVKNKSIFTEERTHGKTLFVLFTSDKGLCGPLNNKLINALVRSKKWLSTPPEKRLLITIGKKSYTYAINNKIPVAKDFIGLPEKFTNLDLIKIIDVIFEYWQFGENGKPDESESVSLYGTVDDDDYIDDDDVEEKDEETIEEQIDEEVEEIEEETEEETEEIDEDEAAAAGQIKEVIFVAPHYKNSFTFYPILKTFLPLTQNTISSNLHVEEIAETIDTIIDPVETNEEAEEETELAEEFEDYVPETDGSYMLFSPNEKHVIKNLHEFIIQGMFMQAFLELKASEYSSRMIAMQNATDAAKRIIGDLQLAYNKARQQAITQEIAELIGASMAISETE